MSCRMTKPTKWPASPTKTRNSLGILPVWSESSLSAKWIAKDPMFFHAYSEDFEQNGRMPRLIWVFAGCKCHFVGFIRPDWAESLLGAHVILLVLSCGSSNFKIQFHDNCSGWSADQEQHLAWCHGETDKGDNLCHLIRLWHFASSVNSFLKCACAAIQWKQMSDFWSDPSSTSILQCVQTAKAPSSTSILQCVRTAKALTKLRRLFPNKNLCYGYPLESPHRGNSNEYQ